MASTSQVDLFLLGKTGHGKSATGNSIMGREAFQVSDGADSETFEVQVGWTRRLGRIVKVVDGPGLCETRLDRGEAAKKTTRDMSKGILQCPDGFHALVLVLKYGNRFTDEELITVEMLKSIFGQTFVRDFCVLVFTHGELFEINKKGKSFSSWCQEQTGALRALLDECQNRAVLFYNSSEDKSDSQLTQLLSLVDHLESRGVRYTSELFQRAAETREQMIVKENAPELRETIQSKVDLLTDGLEKIKKTGTELSEQVIQVLNDLKTDARDLLMEIAVQDKGTGVLDVLKQVVENIMGSVQSHEEALKEKDNKEKTEAALAQAQQQYQQTLQQLREQKKKKRKRKFWSQVVDFVSSAFL